MTGQSCSSELLKYQHPSFYGRRGRVAKGHSSIWLSAHRKPIIPFSNATSLSLPSWTGAEGMMMKLHDPDKNGT